MPRLDVYGKDPATLVSSSDFGRLASVRNNGEACWRGIQAVRNGKLKEDKCNSKNNASSGSDGIQYH